MQTPFGHNGLRINISRRIPFGAMPTLFMALVFGKKMRRLAALIHHGSRWIFGNGHEIDIWYDSWCVDKPIFATFPHLQFLVGQRLSSLI